MTQFSGEINIAGVFHQKVPLTLILSPQWGEEIIIPLF
jgi:hypothetical protein